MRPKAIYTLQAVVHHSSTKGWPYSQAAVKLISEKGATKPGSIILFGDRVRSGYRQGDLNAGMEMAYAYRRSTVPEGAKSMYVRVTQHDIHNGRRDNCCLCPVALAIKRAGLHVEVGTNTVVTRKSGLDYLSTHWQLPFIAREFIDAFDYSRAVKPFGFYMWEMTV